MAANALPLLLECPSMPCQDDRRERVCEGSTRVCVQVDCRRYRSGARDESTLSRIASYAPVVLQQRDVPYRVSCSERVRPSR